MTKTIINNDWHPTKDIVDKFSIMVLAIMIGYKPWWLILVYKKHKATTRNQQSNIISTAWLLLACLAAVRIPKSPTAQLWVHCQSNRVPSAVDIGGRWNPALLCSVLGAGKFTAFLCQQKSMFFVAISVRLTPRGNNHENKHAGAMNDSAWLLDYFLIDIPLSLIHNEFPTRKRSQTTQLFQSQGAIHTPVSSS